MKKYVLIALLLLFFTAQSFAQGPVMIAGKVENAVGSKVNVYYITNPVSGERQSYSADLEEDGTFQIELSLEEARELTFRHGREISRMFAFPNDVLKVSLDAEKFDESIHYGGEGPGVASSNFLAMYFLKYEDGARAEKQQQMFKDADPSRFQTFQDQRRMDMQRDLEMGVEEKELPMVFQTYMRDQILYSWALSLINYPLYHSYYNQKPLEEVEIPEGYYSVLQSVPLNSKTAADMQVYQQFVGAWLRKKYDESLAGEKPADMDQYNLGLISFAAEKLDGRALSQYQAGLIRESLKYGNPLSIEPAYQAFINEEGNAAFADALKPTYEMAMKLAPGKMAPDFQLKDLEGNERSLSDFRGKVIYLDFWASWCGPCRREMPSARELKARFKEKDVVFLYVSIDENEEAWRKAAAEEELAGPAVVWTKGGSSEVPVSYGIEGIPNYFLINRDGTIALSNPGRPSSAPLVDQQIQQALDADIESSSEANKE
ncbi:MAG: TlpA disulfide reductase family protein [Bacteroidota bacterium]